MIIGVWIAVVAIVWSMDRLSEWTLEEHVNENSAEPSSQKTVEKEIRASVDAEHSIASDDEIGRQIRRRLHFCYLGDVVYRGHQAADEETHRDAQNNHGQTILHVCRFDVLATHKE